MGNPKVIAWMLRTMVLKQLSAHAYLGKESMWHKVEHRGARANTNPLGRLNMIRHLVRITGTVMLASGCLASVAVSQDQEPAFYTDETFESAVTQASSELRPILMYLFDSV